MTSFSLAAAAERFGGTILNPDVMFDSISIDSRSINAGDLFFAIQGPNYNGHTFIPDIENKICGAVVNKADCSSVLPQWVVKDTRLALRQVAEMKREKFRGKVIAVTGSSGKTSVKETIFSILNQRFSVCKTKGNLNNEIGVPLSILANKLDSDFWVIEMGASKIGDIKHLCEIAKPDVALINNIQRAHIEGFGNIENIATAKSEIYLGLTSKGIAIINLDEKASDYWTQLNKEKEIYTFSSKDKNADLYSSNLQADEQGYFKFDLNVREKVLGTIQTRNISLPHSGRQHVDNSLSAAAVCHSLGLNIDEICTGLRSVDLPDARFQNIKISPLLLLVDDSYNANPDSFKLAVENISNRQGFNILVIGDLAELGDEAEVIHRELGEFAKAKNIQKLMSLGNLSRHASNIFKGDHYEEIEHLLSKLRELIKLNIGKGLRSNILIKGSRSSRMERVVDEITRSFPRTC